MRFQKPYYWKTLKSFPTNSTAQCFWDSEYLNEATSLFKYVKIPFKIKETLDVNVP